MTNPNEKEWWNNEIYVEFDGGRELPTVYDISAIVAEAERRGRMAALEETRKSIESAQIAVCGDGEIGKDIRVATNYFKKCILRGIINRLSNLKNV